jgi:putative DNA primase/helicase
MKHGWILEASELGFLKRSDVEELKRFLTVRVDIDRAAYGETESILRRQSIFIGTVNPKKSGYLRDETGNRRFLPVATAFFNIEGFKQERDQIFAEAVQRFKQGEKLYITDSDLKHTATQEQTARLETDSWEQTIGTWIATYTLNIPEADQEELTTDFVAMQALNLTPARIGRDSKNRIAEAMRKSGYIHRKVWSKNLRVHQWVWCKISTVATDNEEGV